MTLLKAIDRIKVDRVKYGSECGKSNNLAEKRNTEECFSSLGCVIFGKWQIFVLASINNCHCLGYICDDSSSTRNILSPCYILYDLPFDYVCLTSLGLCINDA